MSFNLRYILIKRCWNSEEKMAELDDQTNDQQFCLKWNNFQANITSQFEALRFSEDFTDVTIACDGQQLQAHKVVLSACSPYFKELFKANPCSHPIIFMRDVEARHIIALMEFMYVGEVNVSQTHLSTFLKTAESLKIRGLTDTSSESDVVPEENSLYLKPQTRSTRNNGLLVNKNKPKTPQISSTSTVTSSQDVPLDDLSNILMPNSSSPAPKRHCKSETEIRVRKEESMTVNPFAIQGESRSQPELLKTGLFPKVELPEYISDDDNDASSNFYNTESNLLPGGIDILPQTASFLSKDIGAPDLSHPSNDSRKLHSLDPRPCSECGKVYSNLSNLRQHMKLIHFPTYVNCLHCRKQFKTDLYLRRHVLSAHGGVQFDEIMPSGAQSHSRNSTEYKLKNMTLTRRSTHTEREEDA
ncbi:longitudinals lacking protein, isoforms H/M/V-like isoform X5 [Sitophilus oryzae]|uniref:Longitudinals lacking protein, isoforms H/M/V-like isoform X5 n=1 Tax=Sitophilus oryzae TaxID=7048 RepID=A0A6J2YCJ8_SITOR|nr:longitudinals lacking protein, isoforms H/M/V-like isoform X5 [Sitophilus oryzae]